MFRYVTKKSTPRLFTSLMHGVDKTLLCPNDGILSISANIQKESVITRTLCIKSSSHFFKPESLGFSTLASETHREALHRLQVLLTKDDSLEFRKMIQDKFAWIDARVEEGMSPNDALEKMQAFIQIRNIDKLATDYFVNEGSHSCGRFTTPLSLLSFEFKKQILLQEFNHIYAFLQSCPGNNVHEIGLRKHCRALLEWLKPHLDAAHNKRELKTLGSKFYELYFFHEEQSHEEGLGHKMYVFGEDIGNFEILFGYLTESRADLQNKKLKLIAQHACKSFLDYVNQAQSQGILVVRDFRVLSTHLHTDEQYGSMQWLLHYHPEPMLTEIDTASFIAMINDRETWLLNEIVKGIPLRAAWTKMQALIRVRDIDNKYLIEKSHTEAIQSK